MQHSAAVRLSAFDRVLLHALLQRLEAMEEKILAETTAHSIADARACKRKRYEQVRTDYSDVGPRRHYGQS